MQRTESPLGESATGVQAFQASTRRVQSLGKGLVNGNWGRVSTVRLGDEYAP